MEENNRRLLIGQLAYDFEYLVLDQVGGDWAETVEDYNKVDGKPKHVYQFSELHNDFVRGKLQEGERGNYESLLQKIFGNDRKGFRAASTNLRDELSRMKSERLHDAHPKYKRDVMLPCVSQSEIQRKMLDIVLPPDSD